MYYGSVHNAEILLFCSEKRNFLKKIGRVKRLVRGKRSHQQGKKKREDAI